MKSSIPLALLALIVALPIGRADDADEEPRTFESFLGSYLTDSLERDERVITEAIESGTAEMSLVRRTVARYRLEAVNKPVRLLEIRREREMLLTIWDGDVYRAPVSGASLRGVDPEGDPVDVSYRIRNGTLVTRYVGDDGEQRVYFSLSDEGRHLRLSVLQLSPSLPGPIRYPLSYHRR